MNDIENNLIDLSSRIDTICKVNVDSVAKDICKVFITAAETTFGTRKANHLPQNKKCNKPWFNAECKIARNNFHLAKQEYNKHKTEDNIKNVRKMSKEYKKVMDCSIRNHTCNVARKLRQLRTTNSKEYWKILNSTNTDSKCTADINDMFLFFKRVNEGDENDDNAENLDDVTNVDNEYSDVLLNSPILEDEIIAAVKKLKNGKAPGYDNIVNEHISSSLHILLPVYTQFFNIIFDSGFVPEEWLVGVIKPIYKNKGDPSQPENYRPITLLSCLGKLFTRILNNRLELFANDINLLQENQAGFRKDYSTIDHIMTLQFLSNALLQSKKKLFCAFIDFKQAFDTVWRGGLWEKLLSNGITGKCFNYIRNMYKGIKSLVKLNNTSSDFFSSTIGLRQGENLSPFLFSLYINDMENYFVENNVVGLQSISSSIEAELFLYLKLSVLFYADDTVILAESPDDLQYALDKFYVYCTKWKLKVNVDKTKILVFSKGRMIKRNFYYNEIIIENVKEFKYLGVMFSRTGSFCKTKKHLCEQAQKAMYGIIKKIRLYNLPIDCQLDLFDKVVTPVLIYGCEVWGYEPLVDIERIHLKFLKHIFNLKSSTPSYMVYGESGRFPLHITVYGRMISYWAKLFSGPEPKISNILYKYYLNQYCNDIIKNPWIDCIKRILDTCGFSNIWFQQDVVNVSWITNAVKQRLQDQFLQTWSSDIDNSSKGHIYKIFKQNFVIEKYITELTPKYRNIIMKFRTSNHHLPVETGRWAGIPLSERVCTLCNNGQIGDEFHYLLECKVLSNHRKKYLGNRYCTRPNVIKFSEILTSSNVRTLKNLTAFILKIYECVCPP